MQAFAKHPRKTPADLRGTTIGSILGILPGGGSLLAVEE
jgi:TctA family transporter